MVRLVRSQGLSNDHNGNQSRLSSVVADLIEQLYQPSSDGVCHQNLLSALQSENRYLRNLLLQKSRQLLMERKESLRGERLWSLMRYILSLKDTSQKENEETVGKRLFAARSERRKFVEHKLRYLEYCMMVYD